MFLREGAGAAATAAAFTVEPPDGFLATFLTASLAAFVCFGAARVLLTFAFFADLFAVFLVAVFAAFLTAVFFVFLVAFTARFFVFARFFPADAVAARACFAFRFRDFFLLAVATTDSSMT
jgi:hypothetical protein